jgi:SAM-dependent methyltransferase
MTDLRTDAAALGSRIRAHDRFAARDINDWILGLLSPGAEERVLDVGCGTGKQALVLARRARAVVGLDTSTAALAEAGAAAARAGLSNLRLLEGRMESLEAALAGEEAFDAALCCFALYYAASPRETLRALRSRLVSGGRLLVCGPARENNRAFVELCEGVVPREDQAHRIEASLTFMDVEGPPLFREAFDAVELSTFENPVTFPTSEDLLEYWRSYHLYSPRHEAAFRQAAEGHFARHGRFTTVKVVRGALLA